MRNSSKWHGAKRVRHSQYEGMVVFDQLPQPVRDALNYAAVEFSPLSCLTMLKRYSPAQVVTFIQLEDMKLIHLAAKQRDALQDLQDLGL